MVVDVGTRVATFSRRQPGRPESTLPLLSSIKPTALDFFAGAGLVTESLKRFFRIAWANDIDSKKAAVYQANHAKKVFHLGPIEDVSGELVPPALLSWASFPCQDLSLAGNLKGITSNRSGLVWQWLRVMDEMRWRPPVVVAENVLGLIGASSGRYYRHLHESLAQRGYRVGAVVVDAVHWVPQSRKRVFVIGVDSAVPTEEWESEFPTWVHPRAIQNLAKGIDDWVWWDLPMPRRKFTSMHSVLDEFAPLDEPQKIQHNLDLIPANHRERLHHSIALGQFAFTGYKRTRNAAQVLELRFDDIAGCLRTPEGGSSRQVVVIARNNQLGTRLLTKEETKRLMGVRESYQIPGSYNDVYRAMGDAVVVPAVKHLVRHLICPIASRIASCSN